MTTPQRSPSIILCHLIPAQDRGCCWSLSQLTGYTLDKLQVHHRADNEPHRADNHTHTQTNGPVCLNPRCIFGKWEEAEILGGNPPQNLTSHFVDFSLTFYLNVSATAQHVKDKMLIQVVTTSLNSKKLFTSLWRII